MKNLFCLLIGMCLMVSTYAQRTVVGDNAAAITVQPATSGPACESNGVITITLTATGTTLGYQWYENPGSGWTLISNNAIYSGTTATALVITNAPITYNTYQYRCIVTSNGDCANAVTSNTVAIVINANPSITVNPSNATACTGTGTTFSVTATGFTLSYQWQENGINLANGGVYSNVTTATMSISDVTGLGANTYRCIVTGACGTPATSSSATLTVTSLVAVTTQPTAPGIICAGAANQTISVTATGTGLTYQWREDGANIPNDALHAGATTATLTLINPTTTHNYDVVITGTCSVQTSNVVANPINAQATITTAPTAASVCNAGSLINNSTTFSVVSPNASTYQWEVQPGGGWVNVSGAFYIGGTSANLVITDPVGVTTSTQYRVHLTTAAGCNATYTIPVAITINALPTEPTWLMDGSAADTVHYCITGTGTTHTLNPTQGATTNYQLEAWPSLAPVGAPFVGNNGLRTVNNITAGDYVWYINNANCAIRQLQ